jgi:mannose-6-phosphate isomerase
MEVKEILPMQNRVQHYAWGSFKAIAELEGRPTPSERPEAELWMGAHPSASSLVPWAGGWAPLTEALEADPLQILGRSVAARFGHRLPFLFKVLAARAPLSIQAHPNLSQAKAGFERENALGIPLDAPVRNYRDDNHKPEIICALSSFWALKGFRPRRDILELLSGLKGRKDLSLTDSLACVSGPEPLRQFLQKLLSLGRETRSQVIAAVVGSLAGSHAARREVAWMRRLAEFYPDDAGILSPVFLNLIQLESGEALFLEAGELHAYLEGVGVELMANSDNVLRGGLTSKHLDVDELLRVLTFTEGAPQLCRGNSIGPCEKVYEAAVREFRLSVITLGEREEWVDSGRSGVEILLCTEGRFTAEPMGQGSAESLTKGKSILIPDAVGSYRLRGCGTIYRAAVPA